MKVLILSVTAGYGHHATARAIQNSLQAKDVEVSVIDAYQYINRAVQRTIDNGYILTSKRTPKLYRACYSIAERDILNTSRMNMINAVNILGASKIVQVINSFSPDVIICTHVFTAQLMDRMKKQNKVTVPIVGIITDYTIHPFWEDVTHVEYIVTASHLLTYQAVKRGIPKQRLLPFGIPIHSKFYNSISREDAAKTLGIDPKRPTILMMGGSMGYSNSNKLISQITNMDLSFQILAVCGTNNKQYLQLMEMKRSLRGKSELYPYGFVNNIEVMMSAADCIITKPGGLTASEALAKNLPMILVDPVPGHEERNAEFFVNNGISTLVTKTYPIDEAIYQLFENPTRMKTVKENMQAIRQINATETLADFLMKLT